MIVHPLINPKIISSKDGLTATVIAAKKSFAHFAAVFLKRHHKMQGGIMAEETMTWIANFFSCVTTWKNKKMNYLAEIAKYV